MKTIKKKKVIALEEAKCCEIRNVFTQEANIILTCQHAHHNGHNIRVFVVTIFNGPLTVNEQFVTLLQNCIVKLLLWFACGEVSGAIVQVSTIKLHSFMAPTQIKFCY